MVVPGIFPGLTMAEYLAIPAVSAGVARAVVDECPYLGWWRSPFNPAREQEDTKASDVGSLTHQVFLEGSYDGIIEIDPSMYRSKPTKESPQGNIPDGFTNDAIKARRDEIRELGRIPVLMATMAEIHDCADGIARYVESLRQYEPAVHAALQEGGGQSEVTMIWIDNGVPCKLRVDRISLDYAVSVDLKTTEGGVEPGRWGRMQLINQGYYFSAAWYRRGIEKVTGVQTEYSFLAAMQKAPHLCSLVGVEPAMYDLGARKAQRAIDIWGQCATANNWPAYPARAVYPTLPIWESMQFEDKEQQEVFSHELGSQA